MRITFWSYLLLLLSLSRLSARGIDSPPIGKAGHVTRDQLAGLTFGPVVKDLALAVHMPRVAARVGEPLWAYFVVKNVNKKTQGLDMRFDFVTGQTHGFVNACSFTVKPLTPTAKIGLMLQTHTWECGSESLVDVVGKGYYVAALDLAVWGKLGPGEYEVSWQYADAHRSNKVRFKVLAGKERPAVETRPHHWRVWEVRPRKRQDAVHTRPKTEALHAVWGSVAMHSWRLGDLSAALGSGVGDRHVTCLEALPDSDALLSVSASWKPGDEMDRVTLRLSARDPRVKVGIDRLHIYLLADIPEGKTAEEMKSTAQAGQRNLTTPCTIEMQLPLRWRTLPGGEKAKRKFQMAFLLTSTPLRAPRRGRVLLEQKESQSVRGREEATLRIWEGLLKTRFHELPAR